MDLIFVASVILLPVIIMLLYYLHRQGQTTVPSDGECGLSVQDQCALPLSVAHPLGLSGSQATSIQVQPNESVSTWKQSYLWENVCDVGISNIAYESEESFISAVLSEKSIHDLHNDHINTRMQSLILHDICDTNKDSIIVDNEESFNGSVLSEKSKEVFQDDNVSFVEQNKQDFSTSCFGSVTFDCDKSFTSSVPSDKSILESSQALINDPVSTWMQGLISGIDNITFDLDESLISSVLSEKSIRELPSIPTNYLTFNCDETIHDLPSNPTNYLTFNCNESRTISDVTSEKSIHNDTINESHTSSVQLSERSIQAHSTDSNGPVRRCNHRFIWQDLCSDDDIHSAESFLSVMSEMSLLELSSSEFHTDNYIKYCYTDGFFITIHSK